jgi:hypothetical protein
LLLGCFAIFLFRKTLAELINRTRGKFPIGKIEMEVDSSAAGAIQTESKLPAKTGLDVRPGTDPTTQDRLQQVRDFDLAPIVVEQKKLIRADLEKLCIDEREQVELLVKHLAVTQLLLRAESTYRTIFGSQIALLKFLNISGGGTREQLAEFYENAKAHFPKLYDNYSFDQYLHYLLTQILITQHDERYFITVAGQEFLKWMSGASVSEYKAF